MSRNSCFSFHFRLSSLSLSLSLSETSQGWSGGAMVLGKFPVPGRPTLLMIVGQGPTTLVVGAGGGCLDIFTLIYLFSPVSPSLWETAQYRLKYCLKGPLNPKQPINQPTETSRYRVWITVLKSEKSNSQPIEIYKCYKSAKN